jgi:hypothetical protein
MGDAQIRVSQARHGASAGHATVRCGPVIVSVCGGPAVNRSARVVR